MNFISWAFVFLAIPILIGRAVFGRRKNERAFVWSTIFVSTIFVMWHVPAYITVMLTSIGVDYAAAIAIENAPAGSPRRKWFLALSMTTNLAILGFFKYTNFALMQTEHSLRLLGIRTSFRRLGLILPMGISFYTFGSMSYTVDVYRGRLKAVRRFQDFYYFVTFFPHLVAGPIVRAEQFFYQYARTRRPLLKVINHGGFLIIRGAFLKMVCANNIAPAVQRLWGASQGNSTDLVLLTLLFAAQIFCDFEGYSSIARGLAYWLGFRFPLNFDNPYIAPTFSNFWERWHITLSRWLRDYLYIPLGGNRRSASRTYLNLLTVMLLGGLWHGASMTFVVWGGIHGAALAVERLFGLNRRDARRGPVVRFAWFVVVQVTVLVAWIFFRSISLTAAIGFIRGILRMHFAQPAPALSRAMLLVIPVAVIHLYGYLVETRLIKRLGPRGYAALAGVMFFLILAAYGESSEFIYFQF
jgi:alginate O-acetyltransferase complex protein AlgI